MLSSRLKLAFFLVVLSQAAHSSEEYFGRLWEVFAPARLFSTAVWPADPVIGFLIINTGLVLLGFWCYFRIVRRDRPSARAWVWFFVLLETINGLGHVVWASLDRAYRPGLVTAIPFLVLVPILVWELRGLRPEPKAAGEA